MSNQWEHDEVVQRFREYLTIPSVHPDVDYDDCVQFLKKQAEQMDLPVAVHEFAPKKPVVVITWTGSQPRLPSILLNSHMDVVPVYEEFWDHPPFAAHVTNDGWIYARGTQDMKSIGMMHLEAVRTLKGAGVRLKRTVHISFVPDEEIGSSDGMLLFSESEVFKQMNVAFELDESCPSDKSDQVNVFYGERTSRQIMVTCKGDPGHGSFLGHGTAGEKIHFIIDKFMTLREAEKKKLDSGVLLGNVTTINLTQLEGGVQVNVLPESLSASFDIRIAPDVDHDEFDRMIKIWCEEAGTGVTYKYFVKNPQVKNSHIDSSCPFWSTLTKTMEDLNIKMATVICPGATDARFVRRQGVQAINLSPLMDTPMLLHAHNERLHVDAYKRGIDVMEKIVEALANV